MQNPLETVHFSFSERDRQRGVDSCTGIVISGDPGSGKSSTSAKLVAHSYLRAGMGGLVITAKPEEIEIWAKYARETGREKDLIVFSPESGHTFDPMHYLLNRAGSRAAGDQEMLIELFSTLLAVGKHDTGSPNERYWEQQAERLMRHSIKALYLARFPVSIHTIDELIESLPQTPGQQHEAQWQENSYFQTVLRAIQDRFDELTPSEHADLKHVLNFTLNFWPDFRPETRSSVQSTWSGMADKFGFDPLRRLFCSGKCSIIPEMTTHDRKIVVSGFPLLEFGIETGRLINCLLKLVFQQYWLTRVCSEEDPLCFLFADEAQYQVLPRGRDLFFQQSCRGARVAVCWVTQNYSQLAEALGERSIDVKTAGLLANFGLKIWHANSDITGTNKHAADLVGQYYGYLKSDGVSGRDVSINRQQHLMYRLRPEAFGSLKKPDTRNPVSEAFVFRSGAPFECTKSEENPAGQNFLLMSFSR